MNKVKWHKCPEEQIPKNIKKVFITIDNSIHKYVLLIYSEDIENFCDTSNVVAWAEVFDYYKKPTKKSENNCEWIEYTFKKIPTQGKKVVTYIKYSDSISKRYVDTLYSYEGFFPNVHDKNILAWTDMPEPYEKKV